MAVLNSQQQLQPHGGLPWVQKTNEAVRWAKDRKYSIVSSNGVQSYDLLTALAELYKVPYELIPLSETKSSCQPSSGRRSNGAQTKETRMLERDNAVIESADLIVPVCIRPNGRLDHLIRDAAQAGKMVEQRFSVPYTLRKNKFAYSIAYKEINPALESVDNKYCIHWTRSSQRPWPNESPAEYYRDVISSTRYPRNAFDTLTWILTSGTLIASSRHMPQKAATVSFTYQSLRQCLGMMRWRARYHEMSFEPYGIGITLARISEARIYPVQYGNGTSATNETSWLTQSIGLKTDWRQEQEYRHLGDLDLNTIPDSDKIVFTRFKSEAAEVEKRFGLQALPVTGC